MTQSSTRIEVLVDAPLVARIVTAAQAAGILRYMIVPTLSGQGPLGRWRRDEVTGTTTKQLVIAVCPPEQGEALIEALRPLVGSHDLQIVRSTVEMLSSGQ